MGNKTTACLKLVRWVLHLDPLPLHLTLLHYQQIQRWMNQRGKLAKEFVLLCKTDWMAKVLLLPSSSSVTPPPPPACYRGAAELRWARVSSTAAHISNFLLTTKAIRKLPSLTLCTEPLFIRRIRARPAGSWFISANKGFGQQRWKHLFWGLNILYLSELSRLTENCYDVHNYTSFFISSSALAAVL